MTALDVAWLSTLALIVVAVFVFAFCLYRMANQ